ncbi:lachrymatory-factor synthase [Selaginella moellendorffii]|nr:lachrymatory-factor synthase [Selaginella moellendorffii]XP_024537479.1 lachrymatory-factor synthase [Selaginella moellendorffii]XP_024537480.1 lachrymatory-factor synthase [Selaginella moellendorffii]XP_024537481.1 lachrymatory-factor synthase [Selaginella moellendorffii]|eukprot:XP_024537478.1 lachrymatory-factor synthase [Selaginella moellendorffii]
MMGDKWSGGVTRIVDAPAAKLWELASDFCGLCKWMPLIEECRRIQGDGDRAPGCVRLVVGTSLPRDDGQKSWITEKLVAMDPSARSFTYVLEDGNIDPLSSGYSSTFTVSASEQDSAKSRVEWRFEISRCETKNSREIIEFMEAVFAKNIASLVLAASELQES